MKRVYCYTELGKTKTKKGYCYWKCLLGNSSAHAYAPQVSSNADLIVAAIYLGLDDIAKPLIDDGIANGTWTEAIYIDSKLFRSALRAATLKGNRRMIEHVVKTRSSSCRHPPWMPIEPFVKMAASYGHIDALLYIISTLDDNLSSMERNGDTSGLFRAISLCLLESSTVQLFKEFSSQFMTGSEVFQREDGRNLRRLARSAKLGHLEMVRYFLDQGTEVNREMDCGKDCITPEPLHEAIIGGNVAIVKLLLNHGADPNRSFLHTMPLALAVRRGSVAMVQVLIDAGADVNGEWPPPITIAVYKEDMVLFQLLRKHGARLDMPESGGSTMAVAMANHLESMVQVLEQEGVDQHVLHYVPAERDLDWIYLWYTIE